MKLLIGHATSEGHIRGPHPRATSEGQTDGQTRRIARVTTRHIVAAKDPQADLDADHAYTDWTALAIVIDDWVSSA